jgi:hypothetical protein
MIFTVSMRSITLKALVWLALGLLTVPTALRAQTLDDVDVRSQGDQRIVRIRLNASVHLVQLSPSGPSDQFTLQYELLQADENVIKQMTAESRTLPAADGLPAIAISVQPDPGIRARKLLIRLSQPLVLQARQGANSRSLELVIRVATAAEPSPVAAPQAAPEPDKASPEVEADAAVLMAKAREALAVRQADAAVDHLNALLKLPPNSHSVAAQELIGQAWELGENPTRARVEYSLYLKLYPHAEGATRVTQRLTALGGPVGQAADGQTSAAATQNAPKPWSGSIAQYYYGGKAKSKSLVNIATGIDQATISHTTESAVVTSLDLSGRLVGEGAEYRAVVRGSGSTNLLQGGHSSNSIGAVYAEYRRNGEGLAVRAGRQSPISGGLLGLFDGVSMAYPIAQGLKLDVMGGVPASALVSAPGERLFAAVLEADTFAEHWGGNFYLLNQSTEGITNRRALGAEIRYAGEQWSLNTMADFDAVFKMLNALSVHGSVQLPQQTTVTMLVDERRAPSLQLTNALISSGAASLKTLLQVQSLAQVQQSALNTSAIARQLLISASRPLNPQWQLSGDLRYSAIGALPQVGDFEAQPATGGQFSLGSQLTGTNLYSQRDINNFNLSVMSTPFFKGVQFSYNNLTGLREGQDLTFEPSVRLYMQRDKQDVKLMRFGPGARLSWRYSQRSSLLGELLYEYARSDGPTNHDHSSSVFFYLGYRHELF